MKAIKIFALMAVVLPLAFVSCSKDDDKDKDNDNGSSSQSQSSSVSVIKTDDGVMTVLKKIDNGYGYDGYFSFSYDSEGRCTSVYDEGYFIYFSYDPFECTFFYDDDTTAELSFNSSGYLSEMSYNYYTDNGTNYNYSDNGTYAYSYDSSGHLIKVSYKIDYGKNHNYQDNLSYDLTWTNGNVKKIECSHKGTVDDVFWTEEGTIIFKYGDTKNDYYQFPDAIADYCLISTFSFIGYCGKGTALLPESCEHEYEYEEYAGEEYCEKGSSTDSFSFTKSSDGLIKTETSFGETITYSYDYISPNTRSMMTLPYNESTAGENTGQHRRMFDRRGQHHSPHYRSVHSYEE